MAISEKDLSELEQFFGIAKLPAEVQLDGGTKITDVPRFIESHLEVLRNNNDKPIYEVFYQRLLKLKSLVQS